MSGSDQPVEKVLAALHERAKELTCLYAVDEALSRADASHDEVLRQICDLLPAGWQYPEICSARVEVEDGSFAGTDFAETPWLLTADIIVEGDPAGRVTVAYREARPEADEGPFLREERRLINAIAERIGTFLLQRRLREALQEIDRAIDGAESGDKPGWQVILDFLRRTDERLLARVTRRMINHLSRIGVPEAEPLLREFVSGGGPEEPVGDSNVPSRRRAPTDLGRLADRTFELGIRHCSEAEIVSRIGGWIEEDKASFALSALANPASDLTGVSDALERFHASGINEEALPTALRRELRVSLLRRLFTSDLDFLGMATDVVEVANLRDLTQRTIHHAASRGKLGGKAAGLFLAERVLRQAAASEPRLADVKTPRTWYVASDCLLAFIDFNNLEDLYERKYMPIEDVRREYPHIIQLLKNSRFPPSVIRGLSAALDDLGEGPIIVRSSSLLEDSSGAAFSGKYKSLFLANQGSKQERLEAVTDAIAEVYASVFGPDPIQYRAERGLLDFHEEMGIQIQKVVGRRVGRYFFPAFAGVVFSRNEFRWSPRIRREDGLIRMVPGLGTRAVDRVSDDYSVLVSPGQPGLRVNATVDEVVRYSPRSMDVIDLETHAFETVPVTRLMRECGDDYPAVRELISMVEPDHVRRPGALEPEWDEDEFVVTFEGLLAAGSFVPRVRALLAVLEERLGRPVDLEFAHDGEDLYLLQCRAQSYREDYVPAAIPRNLPRDRVLFSANRFVSNGRVGDITHIVYVDGEQYAALSDRAELLSVARVVGKLNQLLPKRQFILVGPGRWGSRGDIRLGVSTTYSDISNTAALLEVARQKGGYVPELSFGTHFFQDLVEADIRYLPLYPDEAGNRFNEGFLRRARNLLPEILPEHADLADVIRVIDVPDQTEGQILRILLNADLDEAVGLFDAPVPATSGGQVAEPPPIRPAEEHWRWRLRMAERIASQLDPERFGVRAIYVLGSTKNATAGPASDIDLIVHVDETHAGRDELAAWLEGWSLSLAEDNFMRTGYRVEQMLDVHYVTDRDIERRTSFAAKIGAVTDAARPLKMKKPGPQHS